VLIYGVVVMLVTTIPYLLGYLAQGADRVFTGFVISVEDGNAFIAKMWSGTLGDWLFQTPYTAFPQRGFPIFLPYILLGKLASSSGTHNQLVALYHVFRILAGVLAILATYQFLSLFVAKRAYRRLGLVLVTLGGGLGWLLVILGRQEWLGSLPLEFYSPESYGFLGLYAYPHYALARALLLWGLVAFVKAARRANGRRSGAKEGLIVGVLWLLTGLAQPLTGMVVCAVAGITLFVVAAWQVWLNIRQEATDWPKFWGMARLAIWAGIVPAPFVLYNLISTRTDPFLQLWTGQSAFASPHPLHYLLAYGLILPFAVVGARHLWRRDDWTAKLPVAWALFLPVLAYAPISVQRRLPEGIWVAFVILAMVALEAATKTWARRSAAVLLLAFPSTLLLLVGGALTAAVPAEPLHRPADEVAVFQTLADRTSRDSVVLSSYESGNAFPAWAPVFVVVGHGPESVGLAELMPRVEAFYQEGTPQGERIDLLTELGIDFVFWGPHERALGGWDPHTAGYLRPYAQTGDYTLFAMAR
jgi:hypothetical protein